MNYKETLKTVIEEQKNCLFWDTSMILDIICTELFHTYKLSATFKGRSIYIGNDRVASIVTGKEGKNLVYIDKYYIL